MAPSASEPFAEAGAFMEQFFLFGDSLIQHSSSQDRGFALTPALQAEYIRRLDVVNRGFSGYNTDQALRVFGKVLPSPECARIRFILIFFGANDSCLEGAAGSQHVPLARFRQNILEMLSNPTLLAHRPRIILVTPPPINEYACEDNDRAKGYMEPRRKAWHTKLYADAVRQIAQERDLALVDLWSVFMGVAGYQGQGPLPGSRDLPPNPFFRQLMHDGLHFTSIAYTTMFQELMRVINKRWPEEMPEQIPFVLPEWNKPGAWLVG